MPEGVIAVVCYRPKPGKEAALQELLQKYVPILRQQGLITDYPATLMTSQDGTLVEIFEWKSPAHSQKAPTIPEVKKIWDETSAISVCSFLSEVIAENTRGRAASFRMACLCDGHRRKHVWNVATYRKLKELTYGYEPGKTR